MQDCSPFVRAGLVVALACLVQAAPLAWAEETQQYTALAVTMGNRPGLTGSVDIVIERWSTNDERLEYVNIFKEKGAEGLRQAFLDQKRKDRAGYFRTQDMKVWDLRFAWQLGTPGGGRHILIATDRRTPVAEAYANPRTKDYPFTIIELRVDAEGKGEGAIAVMTKLAYDEETKRLELEAFGQEPVRLNNVQRRD